VFAEAVTVTLPLPDPDVGVTDSAALAVEADHADGAHPDGVAVTFTICGPPPVAKFVVDGEIVNVHALIVAVGWVVEGVEDDGPLHAVIARNISETATVIVRFIGRDYSGIVIGLFPAQQALPMTRDSERVRAMARDSSPSFVSKEAVSKPRPASTHRPAKSHNDFKASEVPMQRHSGNTGIVARRMTAPRHRIAAMTPVVRTGVFTNLSTRNTCT
jgi:hypothetical protein